MRQICVVLVIALSAAALGREASAEGIAAEPIARPLTRAFDEAIKREASLQMARYPGPRRTTRCCNVKGAAIGAAIGAGLGFGLASQCDGGGCWPTTFKATGILGGIGAGIGIFM
jgi:hypothetical protein